MRILWFSNRPPSKVIGGKKTIGGSWIESLENQFLMHSEIELGFVYNELAKEPTQFCLENLPTEYFMVPRRPYNKFRRWFERFFSRPPSQEPLKEYMRVVAEFQPDAILFFGTEYDHHEGFISHLSKYVPSECCLIRSLFGLFLIIV